MATIAVPAVGDTGTAGTFADAVANALNNRVPVFNQSNAAASTTTTTEVKDTNVGDLAITVTDATAWYVVKYICRGNSSVTSDQMDIRIRDGGGSSPTNVSTQLAGASLQIPVGGSGGLQVTAEQYVQFTVGTHTIAGFYVRTAGTGNVNVSQAGGAQRVLSCQQVG